MDDNPVERGLSSSRSSLSPSCSPAVIDLLLLVLRFLKLWDNADNEGLKVHGLT